MACDILMYSKVYAFLTYHGQDNKQITCVGHSLGAHICGMVTTHLTTRQHKIIGRLFGHQILVFFSWIMVKQLSHKFSSNNRPGSSQTADWATGAAIVQIDARRRGRSTGDTHECGWSWAGIVYRFTGSVYQRRKATAVLQRTHHSYVLWRWFGLLWERKWN